MRADLHTSEGEVREFELPDGSRAWLSGDSALALNFSAQQRELRLLRGEALFDVRSDASRSFVVRAAGASATAIGTRYAVAFGAKGFVDVRVEEGRVAVRGSEHGDPSTVSAGFQVQIDNAGRLLSEQPLQSGSLAWRRGLLVFEHAALDTVVQQLDRYISGRVLLLGTHDQVRVTAAIATGDARSALLAIAAREGLRVDAVPGVLVVLH
jgi:transmembrane sensor